MSDTKMGNGLASGMFFHAPAGTELPASPYEALSNAWRKVGDVSDAGITLTTEKSTTNLKNWANVVKRVVLTDHSEKVQAPIMDTTEEVLKTVLGKENVTTIEATDKHGRLVSASLSGQLPKEEAFLWLMKDGDDMIMVGCQEGQIMSMADITFAPGTAITWTPTITALGDSGMQIIMDDGKTMKEVTEEPEGTEEPANPEETEGPDSGQSEDQEQGDETQDDETLG